MTYNPKDFYFKKAKKENYVARSIYKLEEIDQRFKIIDKNDVILDLGSSPGSWSQYCLKKTQFSSDAKVVGVDLNPITFSDKKYLFYQKNIFELDWSKVFSELQISGFDVVLSDMAPKTTGIRLTDQMRSFELCQQALSLAKGYLHKSGHFVCKLFHSSEYSDFQREMKKIFKTVESVKPDSTRKISKEIFLIGLNKK